MARIKAWRETPRPRWVAQQYRDHALQLAIFMTLTETNPEALPVRLPQIAIQVYSTVPLSLESEEDSDDDYISLCRYLSSKVSSYPTETMSFEIYAPQPDVFACVEHQRREIRYRKNNIPREDFLPSIAKVAPDNYNQLLQGFLLVITSYSFRDTSYRNMKLNPARLYSEREELIVRKCRHIDDKCRELSSLITRSHSYVAGHEFDYGLNEDEGDPSLSYQPLALQMIELLQSKADSLDHDQFDIKSPSDSAVAIKSNTTAVTSEIELQYIIYIAFHYEQLGLELMTIAKAFTGAILENLPGGKTVNFEFFSADQSLAAILAWHRDLVNSRPDIAVGALHKGSRSFPQKRHEPEVEIPLDREPYRTFFVILDRPDFLAGPGVLFFLTDGNEIADEAMERNVCKPKDQREDYAVYQVWRSAGMSEAARRLAVIPTNLTSWVEH